VREILLLLTALATWTLGSHALADSERVALVIGNAGYEHLSPLSNPRNDAAEVAASLEALGFQLIDADGKPQSGAVHDLSENRFRLAVKRFAQAARGAEMALVYYAGHGMQFGARSYLLPVDVPKDDIDLIRANGLSLDRLLQQLDGQAELTVAVFDACREIPELDDALDQATRSSGLRGSDFRGLARVQSRGRNRIVAYSAAAGQLAADGSGQHSPYTEVLLEELNRSDKEVGDLFRNVAWRFSRRHGGQEPEVLIQGVPPGRFYFKPANLQSSAGIRNEPELPSKPEKLSDGPDYEVTGDPGEQRLIATVDGFDYEIELGGFSNQIVHVGDFLLNGHNEVLLSNWVGNCCPNGYYFVVYKGEGNFHVTDAFISAWSDPDIEPWRGKYSLVASENNEGVNTTKREQITKRFVLDTTGQIQTKLVESHAKQYARALAEMTSEQAAAEGGRGTLRFDIDRDGSEESLTCELWERWGLMNQCALHKAGGTLVQRIPSDDLQCKRIGFLRHMTNGVHDLVCDFDQVLAWDGVKYVRK